MWGEKIRCGGRKLDLGGDFIKSNLIKTLD
jgi:hypothetical protein